jgi:hypothetical protein
LSDFVKEQFSDFAFFVKSYCLHIGEQIDFAAFCEGDDRSFDLSTFACELTNPTRLCGWVMGVHFFDRN